MTDDPLQTTLDLLDTVAHASVFTRAHVHMATRALKTHERLTRSQEHDEFLRAAVGKWPE